MRAIAHRLLIAATLAGTLGSAHGMEITREQCELIRAELIASTTSLKNSHEAQRRTMLSMIDLPALNFQIKQMGGDRLNPITDRIQKAIDEMTAAGKEALATPDHSAAGALAWMFAGRPLPRRA